jgi:hypothetical protein
MNNPSPLAICCYVGRACLWSARTIVKVVYVAGAVDAVGAIGGLVESAWIPSLWGHQALSFTTFTWRRLHVEAVTR